jgi:hypothetical protein
MAYIPLYREYSTRKSDFQHQFREKLEEKIILSEIRHSLSEEKPNFKKEQQKICTKTERRGTILPERDECRRVVCEEIV